MRFLFNILYSILLYPLLLVGFHILTLFKKKYRSALVQRYRYKKELIQAVNKIEDSSKVVLIHSASMGEFEHIKPIISELYNHYQAQIIVTFFSPSGYENVRQYEGVKHFMYLPFDFKCVWKKVFKILKPNLIVISKHDVWPNQVWAAQKYKIKTFLINASLSEHSSRLQPVTRIFQKEIFNTLSTIYAISDEDAKRFKKYFPQAVVKTMGDTKFDQVLLRKKNSENRKLIPESWLNEQKVVLLGSVWPEDTVHILPAVAKILNTLKNIRFIIVPHQPEERYIESISNFIGKESCILFSEKDSLASQPVLIVNKIGVLADLYKYADVAYVGGSFKQGIHNVMEPAIYEIPVLYGPTHKNSYEAIKLNEDLGSFIVSNKDEIFNTLVKLLNDEPLRQERGKLAGFFANQRIGGTQKLLKEWQQENFI